MADTIKMTVSIRKVRQFTETKKRADGTEFTSVDQENTLIYEQTVDDLNIEAVIAVVNNLVQATGDKKPLASQ